MAKKLISREAKVTILKLGGSAITFKHKFDEMNTKTVERLAMEVKEADVKPLVIVHGGGGMAHWRAKKYSIKGGYKSPNQIFGVSETHYAMMKLNKVVIEALLKYGIPVFPFQSSALIMAKSGMIHKFKTEPISKALYQGFVPVLYGDVTFDLERVFTIISGDQIISKLALKLPTERIVFGLDVDGIYTADPHKNPSAKFIPKLSLKDLREIQLRGAWTVDVTGGMKGKIQEMIPIVKRGIKVIIVNALEKGRVYKALKGKPVKGTIICR